MATTTDQRVTAAADRLRAAIVAFNAAADEAAGLGVRVEVDQVPIRSMAGGEYSMLTVQVWGPR